MRRALLAVPVVGLLVAGGIAWYLGPIAPVATGYAAKTLCSGHFVSGRSVAEVEGDLPSNPLVPFLRSSTDEVAGTVRTSLLGLWASTAWHADGAGCTLADGDPGFTVDAPAATVDRTTATPSSSGTVSCWPSATPTASTSRQGCWAGR